MPTAMLADDWPQQWRSSVSIDVKSHRLLTGTHGTTVVMVKKMPQMLTMTMRHLHASRRLEPISKRRRYWKRRESLMKVREVG